MSFHWHGRNEKGVSKWVGGWNTLLWLGRIFLPYGICAGLAGLGGLFYLLLFPPFPGIHALIGVGLIHALVFGLTGAWALKMHRRIQGLSPMSQVTARLGVDAKTFARLVEERGILPIYNINDEDYYDPKDLGDVMTLLRAASAPEASSDTLLRAASPTNTNSSPEQLLRASNGRREG